MVERTEPIDDSDGANAIAGKAKIPESMQLLRDLSGPTSKAPRTNAMPRQVLEVFLSSTAKDLVSFRSAVHARLTRSGQFHCVRQEDFGPQSVTAIELCRRNVESADLFIGLIGLRRGWEPPSDATHRSITEMEHDWAAAAEKRRYVWVTPNDFPVAGDQREPDAEHARQQTFRTRLMADGALVVSQKGFDSPELLAADITEHLLVAELVADLQRRGEVAKAERSGLERAIIAKLARQLKPDEALDFDQSVKELENAVNIALDAISRGNRGVNEDEFVNAILKRIAEQTKAGEFDRAAREVDEALVELARREIDQREALQRSRVALVEAGVQQDILRHNASAVARRIERIAASQEPHNNALRCQLMRQRQEAFYIEGRDKGINFSLEIAIELARSTFNSAKDADERGTILNDLGTSLATLGERESSTSGLEEAVTAYQEALREYTRERAPLLWAMAQNNLGNALQTLGARESGTVRLEVAVVAYQEALRERVPLDWAMTQNNLGNALATLGARESPLDWAMTQNNLGSALQALGARESGTARLEAAVAASQEALHEYTRERVPLLWATTQNNLGNALATLGARESGTARLEEAVTAYHAAIEVFGPAQASYHLEVTQRNLARAEAVIASRRSDSSD